MKYLARQTKRKQPVRYSTRNRQLHPTELLLPTERHHTDLEPNRKAVKREELTIALAEKVFFENVYLDANVIETLCRDISAPEYKVNVIIDMWAYLNL